MREPTSPSARLAAHGVHGESVASSYNEGKDALRGGALKMRIEWRTCEEWSRYLSTEEDGNRRRGAEREGKEKDNEYSPHTRNTSFVLHLYTAFPRWQCIVPGDL
jgi:hypothetical protein